MFIKLIKIPLFVIMFIAIACNLNLALANQDLVASITPNINYAFEGQLIIFTVSAQGSEGTLHYSWSEQNGVGGTSRVKTYAMPSISESPYEISCTVTDDIGSDTATENITICNVDLDIDTDNDSNIDSDNNGEDQYEEFPPGKVISVNLEGDGIGQDMLAQINLSVTPACGSVELKAASGGSYIKIYENANKTGVVNLPETWASASDVPEMLFVDGIHLGQVVLELSYTTPDNGVLCDEIALFITEPISWAPDPENEKAYIWSSLPSALGTADGDEFEDQLELQGFDVIWLEDVDNHNNLNFNDCTINNYKNTMVKSGALTVISHGDPGCHYAVYAEDSLAGSNACAAWIGNEPNMIVDYWLNDCYTVRVSSKWLANNWASELNNNKTIALWSICYSATANPAQGEAAVKEAAGGRWRSGYIDPTDEGEATFVNEKFLQRMNGKIDNREKRTAGKAWQNGIDYLYNNVLNVRMDGNDWTTLCPAPMKESPVWPKTNPGDRKGSGCIIFDTYMNDYWPNVVDRLSGRSTYDHNWIDNDYGPFGFRFKFGETGGTTTMRADWEECRNYSHGIILGRQLDGDRKAPNKDHKEWSF